MGLAARLDVKSKRTLSLQPSTALLAVGLNLDSNQDIEGTIRSVLDALF